MYLAPLESSESLLLGLLSSLLSSLLRLDLYPSLESPLSLAGDLEDLLRRSFDLDLLSLLSLPPLSLDLDRLLKFNYFGENLPLLAISLEMTPSVTVVAYDVISVSSIISSGSV